MIDRIRGRLVSKGGSSILLETASFVLDVLVPLSTMESLQGQRSEVDVGLGALAGATASASA